MDVSFDLSLIMHILGYKINKDFRFTYLLKIWFSMILFLENKGGHQTLVQTLYERANTYFKIFIVDSFCQVSYPSWQKRQLMSNKKYNELIRIRCNKN